ncbi:TlyA family rRNA (cytidine-2'-O)-methyltransferase [Sneathiella chinensis]|uniref:TlyA family rRNA (Cytidine-2'-O)-methyltransferase n=2 Tax=Sneathiella chinensis TaxID=349750 RepID=A0ABQ5U7E5_9PROT|nr:TlyA family rRNA (cytidine-2'-O)-methyltransferase [Sneathiella chinensis]
MISDGRVSLNGVTATKANRKVSGNCDLSVETLDFEWVGRGALKLIAALDHFGCDCQNKVAVDIGASTGGFSQVLLRRGAERVYAVDVGHGQLAPELQNETRLINLENLNARHLSADHIPEPIDLVVSDVSFISLTKALPAALNLCRRGAVLAVLVKPQFEVGKGNLGKGGIVRDLELKEKVRRDMEAWIDARTGWRCLGSVESPITGSDGNTEYLMGASFDA